MVSEENLKVAVTKLEGALTVIGDLRKKYSSFLSMVPGNVKSAVDDLEAAIKLLKE